ncbi:hypothetical protein Ddye_001722 [Dipteronia dyeriana]|uniref:Uncharacterized protein n=1 Tax=Dipteronia dyeriana TaxID=168575 RepID=A0AAE0CU96_9ROSI|nr:hypothetical protein Ddye_001722 [Dipteronia dyeriana]
MDSSKYYLMSSEGCSSSESGWTKYMDSPMQEDDSECSNVDDGDDEDDKNDRHENHGINRDRDDDKEESDDSMTSDASSGPSHQHKRANDKASRGIASSKHSKLDHVNKLFSWKKTNEKDHKHKKHGK